MPNRLVAFWTPLLWDVFRLAYTHRSTNTILKVWLLNMWSDSRETRLWGNVSSYEHPVPVISTHSNIQVGSSAEWGLSSGKALYFRKGFRVKRIFVTNGIAGEEIWGFLLTWFDAVGVKDTLHQDTSPAQSPCPDWPRLLLHERIPWYAETSLLQLVQKPSLGVSQIRYTDNWLPLTKWHRSHVSNNIYYSTEGKEQIFSAFHTSLSTLAEFHVSWFATDSKLCFAEFCFLCSYLKDAMPVCFYDKVPTGQKLILCMQLNGCVRFMLGSTSSGYRLWW